MSSASEAERLRQLRAEYDLLAALIDEARVTGDFPPDARIVEIINRSSTLRAEIADLESSAGCQNPIVQHHSRPGRTVQLIRTTRKSVQDIESVIQKSREIIARSFGIVRQSRMVQKRTHLPRSVQPNKEES